MTIFSVCWAFSYTAFSFYIVVKNNFFIYLTFAFLITGSLQNPFINGLTIPVSDIFARLLILSSPSRIYKITNKCLPLHWNFLERNVYYMQ